MTRFASALLAALLAAAAFGSPPEAVAAALAHAEKLDPYRAEYTRYLDISHFRNADDTERPTSAEERRLWFNVESFLLNSLSKETAIVRPESLCDGGVLAFCLLDYGIDRAVYKRLETVDRYYHVRADVKANGKVERVFPTMPHTGYAANMTRLVAITKSSVPILRGDWFFFQAAQQQGRVAGYYDLLGLGKKRADLDKFIGADFKFSEEKRMLTAAVLAESGVGVHNRSMIRFKALTGPVYQTLDYDKDTDEANVIRVLFGEVQPPPEVAHEIYFVLFNGLFGYWLETVKGDRLDVADPKVANDKTSPTNDTQVHVFMGCARCHTQGLKPLDDWMRHQYRVPLEKLLRRPRQELRTPSPSVLIDLRNKYLTDLDGKLETDRKVFADAVRECNGLSLAENAAAVGAAWKWYAATSVTRAMAARELGCDEAALVAGLKAAALLTPDTITEPVISSYLKEPPVSIRREHFEEVFPLLLKVIGVVP